MISNMISAQVKLREQFVHLKDIKTLIKTISRKLKHLYISS